MVSSRCDLRMRYLNISVSRRNSFQQPPKCLNKRSWIESISCIWQIPSVPLTCGSLTKGTGSCVIRSGTRELKLDWCASDSSVGRKGAEPYQGYSSGRVACDWQSLRLCPPLL